MAAHRLGISERAFAHNIVEVYRKLDVEGLLGALKAIGWLQLPSPTWRTDGT